ncbi:MAG: peptidylprolyl isomerase [Myxococcota bacterium]
MRRCAARIGVAALAVGLGCSRAHGASEDPAGSEGAAKAQAHQVAAITVAGFGTIRIRFFEDAAPGHVANFKKLASQKFYDGTTFHRIIPGFMIQGGDPNTKDDDPRNDGMGGPGYSIKAEFNDISHKRGIVSMARSRDPDSAGSQFFIVVKDSTFLDHKYTAFGKVISGMDVVDRIVKQKRDRRDRPLENIVIESIRIEPGQSA